jgi:hypothetical protein
MESLNSIMSWLKTPAGKRVLENQERVDIETKRREWAAAIQAAEEKFAKVSPALSSAEKAAASRLEKIKKDAAQAIAEAEKAYDAAFRERQKAIAERDQIVNPLTVSLRETANPKIPELADRLERQRRNFFPEWEGEPNHAVRSTQRSIERAVVRINEIILHDLPNLELEILTDQEIDLRLQELEESIPEIKMEAL